MSACKNDCLDCDNSSEEGRIRHDWRCSKGHIIPKDKNGIVELLDHVCKDFSYTE